MNNMNDIVWCCGVVVLWCCGVVVLLWCCDVYKVYMTHLPRPAQYDVHMPGVTKGELAGSLSPPLEARQYLGL